MKRGVTEAAAERYDLVVVGGGIYGAQVTMEAARRGLRPLLIERDDFGGATSWNSLRIVHGGLRYLQKLDLRRFRESVGERTWFCRTYPDLVEPLECLMPLYGDGLKRPGVLRAALGLNDLLSARRNAGVSEDRQLPRGRVLDAESTKSLFPAVDAAGLRGGALWYDAAMTSSARVLMETLNWARHNGATTLNYVEGTDLIEEGRGLGGVRALDRLSGSAIELRAPVVINCAGPWSRTMSERFGRRLDELFHPSLAFNVLLDRPPPSSAAVAVTPRYDGARTYFLRPWQGRIFAGTSHAPCTEYPAASEPSPEQLARFLSDLNLAVPSLELTLEDVVRTYSGLLPAARPRTEELATRFTLFDHGAAAGPEGLWSVSGVKYTTARRVAERTLRRAFASSGRDLAVRPDSDRPESVYDLDLIDPSSLAGEDQDGARRALERLVRDEQVVCMEDLLLRRTDWGTDPKAAPAVAAAVTHLLGRELPDRVAPDEAQAGAEA